MRPDTGRYVNNQTTKKIERKKIDMQLITCIQRSRHQHRCESRQSPNYAQSLSEAKRTKNAQKHHIAGF